MVTFLHSADWQIGMTRDFLPDEAQSRYSAARLAAIEAAARVAGETGCEFAVVAGDVFDDSQVGAQAGARSLEAMAAFGVPLYLLPGNHDPIGPASVFRSELFERRRPANVHVLTEAGVTRVPGVDAEIVAAPWTSKRPSTDLVAQACAGLAMPPDGVARVVVGHGGTDLLAPDKDEPALIRVAEVEAALNESRIHYVALGDRHSTTSIGATGRIWYSGTQEVTSYRESDPGNVLVVALDGSTISVTRHRVGVWRFVEQAFTVNTAEDVDGLGRWFDEVPDKATTSVKLVLTGTVSLANKVRLDEAIASRTDLFAAIEQSRSRTDLAVLPDDADLDCLGLSGFAADAAADLIAQAKRGGPQAVTAQDALGLLYRLAGRRA